MIAIRFNNDPMQKGPRFIEVEKDKKSILFGEWKQDGDQQLLELVEVDRIMKAAQWILNVASGIGKSGGLPYDDEYVDAMDSLKEAYNALGGSSF